MEKDIAPFFDTSRFENQLLIGAFWVMVAAGVIWFVIAMYRKHVASIPEKPMKGIQTVGQMKTTLSMYNDSEPFSFYLFEQGTYTPMSVTAMNCTGMYLTNDGRGLLVGFEKK